MRKAFRGASFLALVLFAVGSFFVPALAQATYMVTVQTNAPSYSGTTPIVITGSISPVNATALANTGVIITIYNAAGPQTDAVDIAEEAPNTTTGNFSYTSIPGAAQWTTGTYVVNATWGGNGVSAIGTVKFNYTAGVSSKTSSSSSSSTSSSTTSSSTSSSTTSTSSTTTSTSTSTTILVTTSTSTSTTSTTKSSGGLGSLLYVIVAVIIIVVAGLGFFMWRRSVAQKYGTQATK